MLFERQRLLLSLLDAIGGPISNTDFQKLLLLYTKEFQDAPSYEFVPYRFGGFSFTSYADKRRLMELNILVKDEQGWAFTKGGMVMVNKYALMLPNAERFRGKYGNLRGDELIAETYRKHPYYATRSEILTRVLSDETEKKQVEKAHPTFPGPGLITIGYEQKSLEKYLNQLFQAGVTLLCDVRRNPLSRKYGFSKSTLAGTCKNLDIRYVHLPDLGIASDQRKSLATQADYEALFSVYEQESLPRQKSLLEKIRSWIQQDNQRVALTCFELVPQKCHRHCIADALQISTSGLKTVHL